MDIKKRKKQESVFSKLYRITDDFEQNWTCERKKSIEETLSEGANLDPIEFFNRLLEIDILLGKKNQALLPEQNYLDRFPQFAPTIHKTYAVLTSPDYQEEPKSVFPKMIDHYQVEELLGKGAMGIVCRGTDLKLQRPVAIKFLSRRLRTSKEAFDRFREELSHQGQLDNENVVRAYHCGEIAGQPYLVMEYVDGVNLERYVSRIPQQRLSPNEAVGIILQAAKGLRHIHGQHIIHRDVKPGNILRRDSDGCVKICDVGLGVLLGGRSLKRFGFEEMSTFFRVGTPGYAAPEATNDPETFSPLSDIYGLGAAFFYLLTGSSPLAFSLSNSPLLNEGDDILHLSPDRLKVFFQWRDIPVPDETILSLISRMTNKNPEERIQSADEVIAELERWQARKTKWKNRVQKLMILTVIILLALPTVYFSFDHSSGTARPFRQNKSKISKEEMTYIPGTKPILHPVPDSLPKSYKNKMGTEFQLMAPCEFSYGAPPIRVTLTEPYYIGRYETTVGEFRAFVDATGYQTTAEKQAKTMKRRELLPEYRRYFGLSWRRPRIEHTDRHPVILISYVDVEAYLNWLNRDGPLEMAPGIYYRYTLPTEAQWENACRAGTTTRFFWGDDPKGGEGYLNGFGEEGSSELRTSRRENDPDGNFPFNDGVEMIAPVGSFKPNGYGLYDMLGNVREWCRDGYGYHSTETAPPIDPMGRGDMKMVRGGGFMSDVEMNTPISRLIYRADQASRHVGFRLAMVPVEAAPSPPRSDD